MEGDTHGQATQSPLQDEQAQASVEQAPQEPPVEQEQVDWAAQLAAKDAEMADMKVGYELRLAGARNVKAAKALLGEYEDDIAKLKDAEPWLFVTQALMDTPGTGTGAGTASGGSAGTSGAGTANGAGGAGGSAATAASSPTKPQGRTGLPSAGAATDEGKELKRWREIAGLNEEIAVTGLGDYTRNVGYKDGSITYEFETKTFNYDRGIRLLADVMDVEEAGILDCFVEAGSELQRTQVAPEADAFCFSTIAGYKGVKTDSKSYADAEAADILADLRMVTNETSARLTVLIQCCSDWYSIFLIHTPTKEEEYCIGRYFEIHGPGISGRARGALQAEACPE